MHHPIWRSLPGPKPVEAPDIWLDKGFVGSKYWDPLRKDDGPSSWLMDMSKKKMGDGASMAWRMTARGCCECVCELLACGPSQRS
jgi:hypothetical protein